MPTALDEIIGFLKTPLKRSMLAAAFKAKRISLPIRLHLPAAAQMLQRAFAVIRAPARHPPDSDQPMKITHCSKSRRYFDATILGNPPHKKVFRGCLQSLQAPLHDDKVRSAPASLNAWVTSISFVAGSARSGTMRRTVLSFSPYGRSETCSCGVVGSCRYVIDPSAWMTSASGGSRPSKSGVWTNDKS